MKRPGGKRNKSFANLMFGTYLTKILIYVWHIFLLQVKLSSDTIESL